MRPFQFHTPNTFEEAFEMATSKTAYLAGGTNQVDLMKKHIATPENVINLKNVSTNTIETTNDGIRLGAGSTNNEVANHPQILQHYPLVSKAILAGASPQIRNMATTGGNLLQRTRCPYFYDTALPCNKRDPGSGCSALKGNQRMSAIIGYSSKCVAVHPSDFCVALVALDAEVETTQSDGTSKTTTFEDFHRLPGENPEKDTNLPENALITSVFVPKNAFGNNIAYVKIRERDSYAFALVSVAAALEIRNGTIEVARLASGGVAHKPWRWKNAENYLKNKSATLENFEAAAKLVLSETEPLAHNSFKTGLLEGAIITALSQAADNTLETKW
ncbi:FAD binding domain-containing protein [Luteirhabdus pelagi]|uniref:FAD binding domain-containing protein n=1 Tax=Luteirhabdus pelagi TaxID=2792783 RepID=UPI001939DBF6|nr:xanthine dehydrogenase family protein subunit M [Luteirhabdus pelagi]